MTPATSPDRPPGDPADVDRTAGRPGPAVRTLDAVTGLVAAGMLVFGVGLLLAALLAPAVLSAAGWGSATGPGWARVLAHLVVGGAGEAIYRTRRRRRGALRVLPDLVVVVAAVAVVALAWWP